MSRKTIEQIQEAVIKAIQMKKILKKIDNGSLDKHRYDNDNTNKSQDS